MDRVHASPGTPRLSFRRLGRFLVFPLLLMAPVEVLGQSPSDRIHEFLESASGFTLLGSIHQAILDTGESLAIEVPFLDGVDYMVVAYCSDTCTNLDLTLFDSLAEEIQSDRLPDAEPILMLTAEATGQYYIQVDAVECSVAGCDIAVGILGSTEEQGMGPGEDMGGRLTLVGAEFIGLGFTEVGDELRGSLNTDQAINFPVTLQEGFEYRMVGVCDKDCFDLDLALLDSIGAEVATDFLEDALPVLIHLPDTTGAFQVEVIMVACAVEPCAYRIATYAKGEDVGPGGTTFSGDLISHETYRGELDSKDELLSGAYLDVYEVEVKAGQRIIVDLRSDDFDTLLMVLDPEKEGEESDDFGYDTGHSHIEMLTLKDGTYSIYVTSFEADSSGAYVLQIAVVG
ncbi:MAG: PPC domain-containing protein [Gemmatimonadota bacterium]